MLGIGNIQMSKKWFFKETENLIVEKECVFFFKTSTVYFAVMTRWTEWLRNTGDKRTNSVKNKTVISAVVIACFGIRQLSINRRKEIIPTI